MAETLQVLLDRRSYRQYEDKPVPRELLEKIAKAGTYAATGMGKQSPSIVCITDKETRDTLERMNGAVMGNPDSKPFYGAPVVFVVLADKSMAGTYLYDGSLVLGNMMNAAADLGLGSCWIHRAKEEFASDEGKKLLVKWGLAKDIADAERYEGIGHLIVGYADGNKPAPRLRKEGYVTFV